MTCPFCEIFILGCRFFVGFVKEYVITGDLQRYIHRNPTVCCLSGADDRDSELDDYNAKSKESILAHLPVIGLVEIQC